MTSFRKPCLDCGTLSRATRCTNCQAVKDKQREQSDYVQQRKALKRLLYGGDYRARRAVVLANATHCHICEQPFKLGEQIDADHLLPGVPSSPLAAAHSYCNRARGSRPMKDK